MTPDLVDLYFSSILAFQYHPANPAESRMTVAECYEVAAAAVAYRNKMLGDD